MEAVELETPALETEDPTELPEFDEGLVDEVIEAVGANPTPAERAKIMQDIPFIAEQKKFDPTKILWKALKIIKSRPTELQKTQS
jgi:hypothetical protein